MRRGVSRDGHRRGSRVVSEKAGTYESFQDPFQFRLDILDTPGRVQDPVDDQV